MARLEARISKLEGASGGLWYVGVDVRQSESKEHALARTLKEMGLVDSQIGYITYYVDDFFESEDRGGYKKLDDLHGWVSHEDDLAELAQLGL